MYECVCKTCVKSSSQGLCQRVRDRWHVASGERTPSAEPPATPRALPKEKSSLSQPSAAMKVPLVDAMVLVVTSGAKQPPETSDVATACRCPNPIQPDSHTVSAYRCCNRRHTTCRLDVHACTCICGCTIRVYLRSRPSHWADISDISDAEAQCRWRAGGAYECTAWCTSMERTAPRAHQNRRMRCICKSEQFGCGPVTLLLQTLSGCVSSPAENASCERHSFNGHHRPSSALEALSVFVRAALRGTDTLACVFT